MTFIDEVIDRQKHLKKNQQRLFAIAYKNCIASLREGWRWSERAADKNEKKDQKKATIYKQMAEEYRKNIIAMCDRIDKKLKVLNSNSANTTTSQAMYEKIRADYCRYRCEVNPDEKDKAMQAYGNALKCAQQLSSSHPIRMGIALNYSVYLYEIERDVKRAFHVADGALKAAQNEGISPGREEFLIEQLMKDNLDAWKTEVPQFEAVS